MAAVAMETAKMLKNWKTQKRIITGYSLNRNWWNLIGTTNFAAVAMETKNGGFKIILDSFHQTSWNLVGISTVVCGSIWGVEQIKMAAVAMVTKVQKIFYSLQTS